MRAPEEKHFVSHRQHGEPVSKPEIWYRHMNDLGNLSKEPFDSPWCEKVEVRPIK